MTNDAYEARIAELEAENERLDRKRFENAHGARRYLSQLQAQRLELARVKAESLRVVPVGEPVTVTALGVGDLMRCDHPGLWQKRGDINNGLPHIVRLDTEIPQGTAVTHNAIVQPISLEPWEANA